MVLLQTKVCECKWIQTGATENSIYGEILGNVNCKKPKEYNGELCQ